MLSQLRQQVVLRLWQHYLHYNPQMELMLSTIRQHHPAVTIIQDHFACIDLPSDHTGIPVMKSIMEWMGFEERGFGYLEEKQNDFLWLAEVGAEKMPADSVLPQVVVADFRLAEMPSSVRNIIMQYANQSPAVPWDDWNRLKQQMLSGDEVALTQLVNEVAHYFTRRAWPLPTLHDYQTVHDFNELLSWVLVFGRQPNHFTFSVHLMNCFQDLPAFHAFIRDHTKLALNVEGGEIKGSEASGVAQGSTMGVKRDVQLADAIIELPLGFVEFIYRYPLKQPAALWGDYFTGFFAQYANRVIESLTVDV